MDLDAIRADLAYLGKADWRVDGTNQAIARVARVHTAAHGMCDEIERLRANQLPEGGTWTTQRRHRNEPGGPVVGDWLGCQPDEPTEECAANGCEQRRVYHYAGPVEPIQTAARAS